MHLQLQARCHNPLDDAFKWFRTRRDLSRINKTLEQEKKKSTAQEYFSAQNKQKQKQKKVIPEMRNLSRLVHAAFTDQRLHIFLESHSRWILIQYKFTKIKRINGTAAYAVRLLSVTGWEGLILKWYSGRNLLCLVVNRGPESFLSWLRVCVPHVAGTPLYLHGSIKRAYLQDLHNNNLFFGCEIGLNW